MTHKPTVDAAAACSALREAAGLNRDDPLRRGSLLEFPPHGQLVMTGDLHGHTRNFEKLRHYANLPRMPARHVMLHELIHEEPTLGRPDLSYELLIAAAKYKCEFPEQVHFLQSNHELAQLTGQRITKGGHDTVAEYNRAVLSAYGPTDGPAVLEAMRELIASYPLAARTPNRIWLSHSLPNERDLGRFDPNVVRRTDFDTPDRVEGGSMYALVWGRTHTIRLVETLAAAWDVDYFLIGHQPQDEGHAVVLDRIVILASDNSHGVFLPFDLSRPQTIESLAANVRKFVEVV